MSPKHAGALLLLSAFWGGSFLFMRIGGPALGPILLIELRVALAGLALLAYALVARTMPPWRARWRHYLVIGLINSALPFVLIATAELRLPASLAATLNATTPLFGALVAAVWIGEALTARKLLGLVIGIVGVVALVGLGPVPLTTQTLWSIGASLLAAVSYGLGAVYTKVKVPGAPPLALAMYSQLAAALLLLPLTPFALPTQAPSLIVVGSVLMLALLCTALAYLLYFYLIVQIGPTRATIVTFLAPVFGVLWGILLLGEPLQVASIMGFGLILASAWLVTGAPKQATA